MAWGAPDAAEDVAAGAAERWSLGVPLELDVVGLAIGVHPEALYRPFDPEGGFHLRAAAGTMFGPELTLISPLALGVRQEFFPRKRVQPGLGTGFQWQTFAVYGDGAHNRIDMYMEMSLHVRVQDDFDVGLQISPEFGLVGMGKDGFYSTFGLGMATRLNVQWNGF